MRTLGVCRSPCGPDGCDLEVSACGAILLTCQPRDSAVQVHGDNLGSVCLRQQIHAEAVDGSAHCPGLGSNQDSKHSIQRRITWSMDLRNHKKRI